MQTLLFEDQSHDDLLPLCYTRPIWDLRVGILRIRDKWTLSLSEAPAQMAHHSLGTAYTQYEAGHTYLGFNGKFLPELSYLEEVEKQLEEGTFLLTESGEVLAFQGKIPSFPADFDGIIRPEVLEQIGLRARNYEGELPLAIRYPWDLFRNNGAAIRQDFELLTAGRTSAGISDPHTRVYAPENIFVEEGASIRAAVLNAEDGPIYIGRGASIQEGSLIRGATALCDHSTINMGAKLRGDNTIGPWSKVGGEVSNSILQGFSNKGHDGFLGNSVLGYWCNLGADTNTSNLKNNYSEVRVWNYPKGGFAKTGGIFCGLIMGDHSKCGINTMFNTGTVVGVAANVFGSGYPRTFIPSFSWGGASGFSTYRLNKVFEVAEVVMKRRQRTLDESDKSILEAVFNASASYRTWEK